MIFYVPDIEAKEVETPHSAHMLSMRLRYKDKVVVTDLKGNYAKVSIGQVDKKHKLIKYHIRKRYHQENTNEGILIQAVPDKIYLEKLVEVAALQGMQKIYFYYSERSVRQKIKPERLQRIVLRGCELAEHYWAPEIEFVEENKVEELLTSLQPAVLEKEPENIAELGKDSPQTVLVGPEGGWSQSEVAYFQKLGLNFTSLGDTVYPAWLAGFTYFERIKTAL